MKQKNAQEKKKMTKERAYDIINAIGGICATEEEVKEAKSILKNAQEKKDFRPEDIKILNKFGIEFDWIDEWENKLCDESDNQTLWHLSRMSYLAGYLRGKEVSAEDS